MNPASPYREGVVYTETVVHSPPQQFVADAPYQIAIVDLDSGQRETVRVLCESLAQRVKIGDRVAFVEERDCVAYFRPLSI